MNDDSLAPGTPLTADHPVVRFVATEVVPKLVEEIDPTTVVVFDPPDRKATIDRRAPGVLIVSARFRGVPMPERLARVHALLRDVSPVRPFCLTPEEHRLAAFAPGPVLGALRTGVSVL